MTVFKTYHRFLSLFQVSEDEDQIQQQTEDSNKKDTETADNFCKEKVVDHLGDIIVEDNVKTHNFHESSVKNNTDTFLESQYNSEHTSQNKISNNCVFQARRCDVGVQTEKELAMGETADVAIQCTIISQCSCKSSPSVPVKEVPSLHKTDSCSEDIRADTTGGQETQITHSKISVQDAVFHLTLEDNRTCVGLH